jgi:hypothetical protein
MGWAYKIMNDLRAVIAIVLFAVGVYFIVDMIMFGFSWSLLIFSLVAFLLVHPIWPPKHDGDNCWYDIFELLVDLPYQSMAMIVRGLGKLFRNGDAGLDL